VVPLPLEEVSFFRHITSMRSLRSRLWVLWGLTFAASVAVGLLLFQLYRASNVAQVGQAEAVVQRACDLIRGQYAFYVTGWDGADASPTDIRFQRDLIPVLDAALAHQAEVEGGIWSEAAGSLAYAFPTYPGTGPKTDFPAAEGSSIETVNEEAATADTPVLRRSDTGSQTLLLAACPLPGPYTGMTAWTMTRVQAAPGYDRLSVGLALLFALVLGIALWVTWLTAVWGRHVAFIEASLGSHDLETLPELPRTGERELDRIVRALNEAGQRLSNAHSEADEMAVKVAASERLAALGRVAAGVAHEIRNPMAAMRLRIENALAGDPSRQRAALETSLAQIARVDALVAELLAMTQRQAPEWQDVALGQFLGQRVQEHRDAAHEAHVSVQVADTEQRARFDPRLLARAIDNILLNAIRHTPPGGRIEIRANRDPGLLRLSLSDTGPGIAQELRTQLFEPFATGRPDGTGLGLAIAREMVEAHGGRLLLGSPDELHPGATFIIELPQVDDANHPHR
jgi:signal transduction histidine kinase